MRYTASGTEIVQLGQIVQHGGAEDCYLLDFIVLKDQLGNPLRVTQVVIPGSIFWMLQAGLTGQFDLLYLKYPKPMGSYFRPFLIGAKTSLSTVDGSSGVRKWVRSSKGAAFHYLWFGLVLMPAFGFGVLLWICALRLLMIQVPSDTTIRSKGVA